MAGPPRTAGLHQGSPVARPGHRIRYELRVRTVVGPVLTTALFPVRLTRSVVPRHSVYRIRFTGDRDIADVVRRLTAADADILDIRVIDLRP